MSSPPDARLPTAAGLVLYLVQSISINSTVLPPPVGPCALASFQETLLLSPPWLKYLEICGLQDQSGFQGTQNPLHPGPGPTSNFISLPCPRLSPKPSGSLPCAFPASLQASGPAVVPSLPLGNAPHPGRKPNCPSPSSSWSHRYLLPKAGPSTPSMFLKGSKLLFRPEPQEDPRVQPSSSLLLLLALSSEQLTSASKVPCVKITFKYGHQNCSQP